MPLIAIVLCCCYKRRKYRGIFNPHLTQEDLVASSNHYELIESQAHGDISQSNHTQEDMVASSNHYELTEPQAIGDISQSSNSDHTELVADSSSFGAAIYDVIPGASRNSIQSDMSSYTAAEDNQKYDTVPCRDKLISENVTETNYSRLSRNLGSCLQEFNRESKNKDNTEFTETVQYDVLDHKVQLLCHQTEDQYDVIPSKDIPSEGARDAVETTSNQGQESTRCDGIYDTIAGSETLQDVKKSCEPLYSEVNKEAKNTNTSTVMEPLDADRSTHLCNAET